MNAKQFVFTLTITTLTTAASLAQAAEPVWTLEFPEGEGWAVDYSATRGEEAIVEYVAADAQGVEGDEISQLVTMQSAPVIEPDFRVIVVNFINSLSAGCTSFTDSVHTDKPRSFSFEWRHTGCNGFPTTREYARFEYYEGSMQVLRYTYYPEKIDADFERWIGIIDAASLPQ